MLDVRRLRVLREVARQGSFSAAADALYLSQSAVSQHVSTLEREVGMRLLERGRGAPRLTDAGRVLVTHADAVICRLEEAERDLSAIAGLEAGEVRLASFPSASATVVTEAVRRFTGMHPKVRVRVMEAEPEDSLPALTAGDADVAIVFDYPGFPLAPNPDLELKPLLTESMHVALPRGHRLADQGAVDVAELADDAWLCGTCPSSCSDIVKAACRDAGFEPRIAYESDDYNVLQGYVAAGLGVTLLPDLALHPLREELVVRPVRGDPPQRRVWSAARVAGARSAATDAMLGVLADAAGVLAAPGSLQAAA